MGLERAVASPYDRPMEPSAGLSSEEVKWTPDGRFVVGGRSISLSMCLSSVTNPLAALCPGSIDGKIHVWDVAPPPEQRPPHYPQPGPYCTLLPIRSIDGHVGGPSRAVAFNPRTAMFASAGNDLVNLLAMRGRTAVD